jgi:hypothetical protein
LAGESERFGGLMSLERDNDTQAENPSAEESETETDKPELPTFPQEAITGLIKRYIDLVSKSTEAPDEFHWAIFLTVVGLLIGRKLYVSQPTPLFLNFYLLLLGQSGLTRKSTAMRFGIEHVLYRIDDQVAYSSGAVSSEGIYEILGKREEQRLLLNYDEARSLLQISRRQVTSDMIPRLNSLFNCPPGDSIDRRKESTLVTRPFVSLITASPVEWLLSAIEVGDVMGGFINRFLIVSGEAKQAIPFARMPSESEWKSFTDELMHVISPYIEGEPIEITWSDEAKIVYEDFYFDWHKNQQSLPGETASLSNRIPDHIIKIAMAISALDGQRCITLDAIAAAVTIGKYLEQLVHILFGDVGLSRQGRVERMIITRLQNKKGMMPFRDLRHAIGGKVETEPFNRAIGALEKAGVIKITPPQPPIPKMIVLVGA